MQIEVLTMEISLAICILGWRLGDGVWQLSDLRHSARCISHGAICTARPSSQAISINCTRAKTTKHNQSTNWVSVSTKGGDRKKVA